MNTLKTLMILITLYASITAMNNENENDFQDNIDPIIKEHTQKLTDVIHTILLCKTPQLVEANFIKEVSYLYNNNEIIALQIFLKNNQTKTIFAEEISIFLQNEFKQAHEELEKHLPKKVN